MKYILPPAGLFATVALMALLGAACAKPSLLPSIEPATEPTRPSDETTTSHNLPPGARLNLSNQGLIKLPSYVLERTELAELDISHNKLTGALPGEIRLLKNLKILNASYNQMTGVPAEVGQLTELTELNLSYNQLTGLPYELGNLKKLKVLNLTGNAYAEQDLAIILQGIPNVEVVR